MPCTKWFAHQHRSRVVHSSRKPVYFSFHLVVRPDRFRKRMEHPLRHLDCHGAAELPRAAWGVANWPHQAIVDAHHGNLEPVRRAGIHIAQNWKAGHAINIEDVEAIIMAKLIPI
jgi:hypothetical protein